MSTILKAVVILLALTGMCLVITTYAPSAWHNGWDIPNTKIQVSWAMTSVLAFLTLAIAKLKIG